MGILDRDYMRRSDGSVPWWLPHSIKQWLIVGTIAVSLLSSILYFARDVGLPNGESSTADSRPGQRRSLGDWFVASALSRGSSCDHDFRLADRNGCHLAFGGEGVGVCDLPGAVAA